MRIIVVGGHGRTGLLVVKQLLERGDEVLATIRNPRHMADLARLGAESIVLDVDKSPLLDFVTAFKGADAVVFAAGSAEGEPSAIDRIGTRRSVIATRKAGIRRYVAISAIGASTGMSTRGLSDEMKDYYKQKRAAGKAITASGLDWTIIEPGELTDAPGTGKVTLSEEPIAESSIPRADVAATVVAVLAEPRAAGHVFQLVGGDTPIAEALRAALT